MTKAEGVHVRTVVALLAPLVLLAAVVFLQLRYDDIRAERFYIRAPIHKYILPAPVVRHFTFGFQNALADYYWVSAVQDFVKWDNKDEYYPEYFRIISTLDKKFEYPYIFAILTVSSKNNPKSHEWLVEIAEKGMRAFPDNWRIPFSAAVEFNVLGGSGEEAVRLLALAAAMPSSPELVHKTHAIYLMRDASDYKKSRALFTALLETSDNEETRRIAGERLLLLDYVEFLEQGVASFRATHGHYPENLDEILDDGKIEINEELLKKFQVNINAFTGKIEVL